MKVQCSRGIKYFYQIGLVWTNGKWECLVGAEKRGVHARLPGNQVGRVMGEMGGKASFDTMISLPL